MGFRIDKGIFQFKDGDRFINKFKIDAAGTMVEVDPESGDPVSAYLRTGDQATDADTVDGIHAGGFIRSDATDNVTGHTEWQDGYNIRLGNGADFRMWHDGSHTYFRNYNHGNGNIYFQGEDTAGANHALLYMFTNNTRPYVSLYEDGAERFKTTSSGVQVLGSITASGGNSGEWNTAYGWGDHASQGYFKGTTRTFTVEGDPETWYPVRFRLYTMHQTFVFRKHVHNSGTWDGDLSAVFVGWSSTWGGDNGYLKPIHISSQTHDFIGRYQQSAGPNDYAIFWFKGGGRSYNYQTYPAYVDPEIFYEQVDMGSNGVHGPRTGLTMPNVTFDTSLNEARAAQTTADSAVTAAATAQSTADTALARADGAREDTVVIGELATAAQAAADAAQATADGKLGATAKAADSDKLDGINSSQFLRSDASDTMGGNLTLKYNTSNASDYNALTFAPYNDAAGINDYIIKAESSRGVFGRKSFGWHVHTNSAFGVYSNGWEKLFGVEGGTGNSFVKGTFTANNISTNQVFMQSITSDGTIANDKGSYLHLGGWAVGRTHASAVLVNTAYRADYATSLFDMNISRFTNNSGYITQSSIDTFAEEVRGEIQTAQTTADNAATAAATAQTTADGKLGATAKAADADKLDGYDWMQSGKSVRANDFYADNWFRNYNSGEGLYNQATTQHWYSDGDDYWNIAGGGSFNAIRFRDEHAGTQRGLVGADNSNRIGFLDAGGAWAVRHDNDSGTLFFTDGETLEFRVGRDKVTGDYGTVQTDTSRGGWGGYSIYGQYVLMSNGSRIGIYNDIDNEWMIQCYRNAQVELRHNGAIKLETTSGGVSVTGTVTATSFSGSGAGLTNLPVVDQTIPVTINGEGNDRIVSINMNLDRGQIEFTLTTGQTFTAQMGR